MDTPFQLGLTRAQKNHQSVTVPNSDKNHDDNFQNDDVIKPADSNETKSWSTSSSESDLLF